MGACWGKRRLRERCEQEERFLTSDFETSLPPGVIPVDELQKLVPVELKMKRDTNDCQLCGRQQGDCSNVITCREEISFEVFEDLMERGWWRTGSIIFIPVLKLVCCPSYALRLPVAKFRLSRSHRRVLKRWNDFLMNGDSRWDRRDRKKFRPGLNSPMPYFAIPSGEELQEMNDPQPVKYDTATEEDDVKQRKMKKEKKRKEELKPGTGPDPDKPPSRKAKLVRAERKMKKLAERGDCTGGSERNARTKQEKSTLLELLQQHEHKLSQKNPKHVLTMTLVPTNPEDGTILQTMEEFLWLYNSFQDAVHTGEQKFATSSELHWAFVQSPLTTPPDTERPLGTYHMRYHLDGELVMVSVVDILPRYFVSIYFIYNPDIRFLQPGIYTVLREIALIQQLQQQHPEMQYYNLGNFNTSNPKLSYKQQFKPSEVLCPVTNTYTSLEEALPRMEQSSVSRLAKQHIPEWPAEATFNVDNLVVHCADPTHWGDIPVFRRFSAMPRNIKAKCGPVLRHYMSSVGEESMHKMAIFMV